MKDYIPPFPPPLEENPSLLRRYREGGKCPLRVLTKRTYRMKLGQFSIFGQKKFAVVDPPLVKRILNDAEAYPKSSVVWRMLYPVIGNSIFVSNGAVWRRQHKLLEPAFEVARIQDSFARMLGAVDSMHQRMNAREDGSILPVDMEMTHVTADVIFRTICSVTMSEREAHETYEAFMEYQRLAYQDMVLGHIRLPSFLSPRWWLARRAAKRVRAVMDPMVRERYERFQRGETDSNDDMLSALLTAKDPETGEPMNFAYDELVEQIAMLFLAGHETSAAALSWALYLIAARADVQDAMHKEAMAVFPDRPLEFRDIRRLPFTRDVFRETLRLYPSVPFFSRTATREEKMRSKFVTKGSTFLLSPWLSQRNELHWTKPHVFDPWRFERQETQDSVRAAYFPFSAGPRVCLGAAFAMQEATMILATLMRDFRFETIADDVPMPLAQLTLRSEHGIRLRMWRRKGEA